MKKRLITLLILSFLAFNTQKAFAVESENTIKLPPVTKELSFSLMQSLWERKSIRSFSAEELSLETISDLLWVAWGINREDGKRTIPTARNKQNLAVYVAMKNGVWLYDAKSNTLNKMIDDNLTQKYNAPVLLFYAAEDAQFADMHVGSMYQNVHLYCAAKGLGTVLKSAGGKVMQEKLASHLPKNYSIRMVQAVGKP